MKRSSKIIAFMSVLALCTGIFSSCEYLPNERVESKRPVKTMDIVYRDGESKHITQVHILTYEIDGHTFQFHQIGSGKFATGGPVHDPNCQCYNVIE